MQEEKENIAEIEELKDVNYRKDYVTFVIKNLHVEQAHRWMQWCSDRGYRKNHHKAFALMLDVLEGKTKSLNDEKIEQLNERITVLESISNKLIEEVATNNEEPEIDEDEKTRISVRKKRKVMEEKKVK